jgi:phosphoglycolate phosphatase-like HAD superfamily hydrolase
MQQSALVFDLDGTLVDSLPDLHAALNANVQVNRFWRSRPRNRNSWEM